VINSTNLVQNRARCYLIALNTTPSVSGHPSEIKRSYFLARFSVPLVPNTQPLFCAMGIITLGMHSRVKMFVGHDVGPIRYLLACVPESLMLRCCHNALQWSPYCQLLQPPRSTAFVGFKQSRLPG
jgi:hypothetical protein